MPTKGATADQGSLVGLTAVRIREKIIAGDLSPGRKLSEAHMSAELGVSRNTLREVFRLLTSQRLLTYIPNRGVFVSAPDEVAVIDIYRVRQIVQKGALAMATLGHPALTRMAEIAGQGRRAGEEGDWSRVSGLNLEFHRAMVELCDSPRLTATFDLVLAELRLVFAQVPDTAHLHAPFIELNAKLIATLEKGKFAEALSQIDTYLHRSERSVLSVLSREKRTRTNR